MSKIEEYKSELVRIQEMSILDTIKLVELANETDFSSKTGRGDCAWLYKASNSSLAIAARIEQLLTAKQQTSTNTTEDEEKQNEAEAEKLLQSVKKELTKRKGKNKKDGKEA
ncbi:hypothetical protein [Acinetobacter lwoffii]|uniref:hypothetical protein n=1 Tax=Acinetobacter lwoffii TaxID=28090 RepID=UPI00168D4497|nr:hypothetical protein [Acinetobacter lwoffii]